MFFSRLLRIFSSKTTTSVSESDAERIFALRHHFFKLFLKSWNKFQETMTAVEYTLCCDHPFGMYKVHELCCEIATQVFQCIHNLERLDSEPIANLTDRFDALQSLVSSCIYPESHCPLGKITIPLGSGLLMQEEKNELIDPATNRLEKLRAHFPENVPDGFVITAVGCHHFFGQEDILQEIARRIQAAGGFSPLHLKKLSKALGNFIESKALPKNLEEALFEEIAALRKRCGDSDVQLLFRGRLWPLNVPEEYVHEMRDPGLVLWGPTVSLSSSNETIAKALVSTLARKFSAPALIYRRARGLTNDDAGFCVTVLALEEALFGGLAHTGSPLDPHGSRITVYAVQGLPQQMESNSLPITTHSFDAQTFACVESQEDSVVSAEYAESIARFAKNIELDRHWPLSLTYVWTRSEKLMVLLARPLFIEEPCSYPNETSDLPVLLSGGCAASLGRCIGKVLVARTWEDARRIQNGTILVVPNDHYDWVPLIDRISGIITESGVLGSRLGSLAREFGKPALFGVANACSILKTGQMVTLCADKKLVFAGADKDLLEGASVPPDYMKGSPVWHLLQHAGEYILPFTLDIDSVDFRSKNCKTYHDIARFCHERAVSAMFSLGAAKKYAPTRVKQLFDTVPKQFWVVNLSNGFACEPKGPLIDIKDITSVPMLAVWHGMNTYPWEGPPPVDGKGFLSVLFEATANPNLEPSAQTTYFSEKNYFLISRDYCSLHSRFGFHFVSVEANLSDRMRENYIVFQLRGGAADIERRILRVRFVADILWEFGFESQLQNDALVARIEGISLEEGCSFLSVVGYLTIHTRQLDMIMQDKVMVSKHHDAIVRDCRTLFTAS